VPIALAALSPASIRLAGELADVWSPFLWARSRLREGRALLDVPMAHSPTRVSVGVPVALGPDQDTARELAAWWLTTYTTQMGPLYPRMLGQRFGHDAAVAALRETGRDKREPALPAEAEALARDVTLIGTYAQAGEAIRSWFAAGADDVQLVLPPNRSEDELAEIVEVAAAVSAGSATARSSAA
jgi:alkanesulfonate monooxygenase SsuD/methylene tetrahydromethanopterin reductase-like flavin-dependent oxidoreductase (luciferase family)